MAKVLLVGIDGGTWNILKPLMADGRIKHFEEIVAEGVHGKLRSTIPYTTLPGWTSMFTGVNPGKHGLIDNMIYEGGRYVLANSSYRMVPTMWNLMSRKELKIILVNDPASYPPEPIGIHITGLLTPFTSKNYVYPPTLRKEIDRIANGYIPDVQREYYEALGKDFESAFNMVEDYAEKIYRVSRYLLKNYEWDIGCVIFTSTDRLQHFFWHRKQYISRHYQNIDEYLKEFLNLISEEEANIIIASDHGFNGVHEFFYINSWLYRKGLLVPKKEAKVTKGFRSLGITRSAVIRMLRRSRSLYKIAKSLTPKSVKRLLPLTERLQVDHEKSSIYAITNLGLFINRSLIEGGYEELRTKLMDEVRKLKGSEGEPIVKAVYRREEIFFGPYIYRAPDIIIIPRTGYKIRSELYMDFRLHSSPYNPDYGISPTGEHAINGILMAYGSDIARGKNVDAVIWDIAPTIMHMHGFPIPKYFDGKVVKEIFSGKSKLSSAPIKIEDHAKYKIIRRIGVLKRSGKL